VIALFFNNGPVDEEKEKKFLFPLRKYGHKGVLYYYLVYSSGTKASSYLPIPIDVSTLE
jgi:hypothetical protein